MSNPLLESHDNQSVLLEMKIAIVGCIFILFGCSAKQEDIDEAKYNLSPTIASLFIDKFYTSENSKSHVYTSKESELVSFDPIQDDQISIYCASDLPLNKDDIYKDDGFGGSSNWIVKRKINVDTSKYDLCFLNLLKKTELNRKNLMVFTRDFNKNDLGSLRHLSSDMENKIAEIKKDGKITIFEALELYKFADSLKQKSLYNEL